MKLINSNWKDMGKGMPCGWIIRMDLDDRIFSVLEGKGIELCFRTVCVSMESYPYQRFSD